MKYSKILWVEDNPQIINWVQSTREAAGMGGIQELLDRIDWAFDRESAMQLAGKGHDLIILDADFPDRLIETRKKYLKEWLKKRYEGDTDTDFDQTSDCWGGANIYGLLWAMQEGQVKPKPLAASHAVGDNFANLYVEVLREVSGPIVVFSSSLVASDAAFCFKLPFYSKGYRVQPGEIPLMDESLPEQDLVDETFLNRWEYGNIEDFVAKYLM